MLADNDTVSLSYANVTLPDGFADWSQTEVYTEGEFRAHSYLDIDGTPMAAAYRYGTGPRLAFCFTSDLAKPLDSDDWSGHQIMPSDDSLDMGSGMNLDRVGGFPCMSFHRGYSNGDSTLRYARSTADKPSSNTDWIISDVVTNESYFGSFTKLVELGGKPVIAYMTDNTYELKVAMSNLVQPTGPNDWVRSEVDPGVGTQSNFDALSEPGVLFLAYYDSSTKDLKLAVLQ